MRIYTADPAISQAGASYFRWSIPCYWLLGFSLTCTIVLRSVGQVKLPLVCSHLRLFHQRVLQLPVHLRRLGRPPHGGGRRRPGHGDRPGL